MGQVLRKDFFEWLVIRNNGNLVVLDCRRSDGVCYLTDGARVVVEGESVEELEEKIKEI